MTFLSRTNHLPKSSHTASLLPALQHSHSKSTALGQLVMAGIWPDTWILFGGVVVFLCWLTAYNGPVLPLPHNCHRTFFFTIIVFIPFFPCHPVTKKGKSRTGHMLFNICVNVRTQTCLYSFAFCNECVIPDILGINKADCFMLFMLVTWFWILSPAERSRNVDFSLHIIAQPWLIKYTIYSEFCVLFYLWLTLIRTISLYK